MLIFQIDFFRAGPPDDFVRARAALRRGGGVGKDVSPAAGGRFAPATAPRGLAAVVGVPEARER